jgi:hypothetical protein
MADRNLDWTPAAKSVAIRLKSAMRSTAPNTPRIISPATASIITLIVRTTIACVNQRMNPYTGDQATGLTLQLPFCFEVGSLSDRLMSSTPE